MKLSQRQLKELIRGAYSFKETADGYLYTSHYTDEQIEYLKFHEPFYKRATFSSSVTVEFVTEATEIGFAYKTIEIGSEDTVDVYVNGTPVCIVQMKECPKEGELRFVLPEGKTKVVIYFPIDMSLGIKDFEIAGGWKAIPRRKTKVLWIGDSITQGYGTYLSGGTYVNVANRQLKYDLLNQGIGGYYYDHKVLMPMAGYTPDKIIVALGINGHINPKKEEMIGDFYAALTKLYKDVPILAITPLWAEAEWVEMQGVLDTAKYIRENAEKYPQIKVVDGFTLLPHVREYFLDGVHPNALGAEHYGNNLVKAIKRLKF